MNNKIYVLLTLSFSVVSCTLAPKETAAKHNASLYEYKPMAMDTMNSLQYKWDNKEVYESMLLDGAESLDDWELHYTDGENVGSFSLSSEKVYEGKSSIKFSSPTPLSCCESTCHKDCANPLSTVPK